MGWYLLIDGDRVGEHLDRAAAANDLRGLLSVSAAIDAERTEIARRAVSAGASVLLANSDTLLVRSNQRLDWGLGDLATMRFTWSAGQARSLALAHAALAVAKARGVGLIVTFANTEAVYGL